MLVAISFADLTGVLSHLSGKTNGHKFPVGDAKVLAFLAVHGACVVKAISGGTGLHAANMSRILDRLERRGFVRRRIGDDKREFVITPTAKGMDAAKSLLE